MPKHNGIRLAGFVVAASTLLGATDALAQQPNVYRTAVSIGASAGVVGAAQTSSGGGYGPGFTASVDVPILSGWDVRVSGGTLHWQSERDWFPGSPYAGRVALDHVDVTVVRHQKFNRKIGYRLEFHGHVTGGPKHSHVRTDMMPAVSLSAGVTRRF